MSDIREIVSTGLCLGCGLCQDSCSKGCITIKHGPELNIPSLEKATCNECGLCYKVCPGKGFDIAKNSEDLYSNNIQKDLHVGNYIACYAGYSNDPEIRYRSSSGGLVSQFLIYLLENKIIDGAVVVGYQPNNPFAPRTFIARTKEEIHQSRGSKYCVVSYEGIAKELLKSDGKYVVVGLPCHIQGFRNYEAVFKSLKNKIIGYFALYCSATKSYKSQEYLFYRYNIDKKEVKTFSYRDEGCMGNMIMKDTNGKKILRIPYLSYYIPMRGFFNTSRCALCIDHYGEVADVCFGDLHVDNYTNDKVGISSWVTRSKYWDVLLKECADKKIISIEEIPINTLKRSQQYVFKHKKGPGIAAAFKVRKILGKKVPRYDITIPTNVSIKYIIREAVNYTSRFIGRRKALWFIIKALDKNK